MVRFLSVALVFVAWNASAQEKVKAPWFGIRVVDKATGRGVPLVELRTVNDIVHVSDSAGWIAFHEPGLMDQEVWFGVRGPGYEAAKDGFGFRGVRVTTTPGATATVKVQRLNIAERVCRLTGQGIYRDSEILGLPVPVPAVSASVLGQDSVQAVPYRGKIFWLWGDTNLANYPLGNFQTTAATSPLDKGPEAIVYTYFTRPDKPERVRAMAPFKEPGVVWLFGLLTLPDDKGTPALVAHYSRRKGLADELEHGLVRFDDEAGVFRKIATLDLKERWRFPRGNAVKVRTADGEHFYFASPMCHTRVKADWKAVLDPDFYEAFVLDPKTGRYAWRKDAAPTTQAEEAKLITAGRLQAEEARYALVNAANGRPVRLHGASVAWNEYRKKWILIGVQAGDKEAASFLGEVWYAEAERPEGPWRRALQVASHPRYSFYNPRHHTFFDEAGGKIVYFEGTYTHTFSGNPTPTPRYDYNQVLYRLDLSDERLKGAR